MNSTLALKVFDASDGELHSVTTSPSFRFKYRERGENVSPCGLFFAFETSALNGLITYCAENLYSHKPYCVRIVTLYADEYLPFGLTGYSLHNLTPQSPAVVDFWRLHDKGAAVLREHARKAGYEIALAPAHCIGARVLTLTQYLPPLHFSFENTRFEERVLAMRKAFQALLDKESAAASNLNLLG